MGKQGPDQFLAELIRSEDTKSVLVLSSGNLKSLIEKLEDSLDRLMVIPTGDVNLQETFDMCIVLEDIEVSKTELGLIKNSVAQKILVIRESVDDKDHQSFLELGFAYDPEISLRKYIHTIFKPTIKNEDGIIQMAGLTQKTLKSLDGKKIK